MRNLSLAILCLLITACGIKGPLELPHRRYPDQHAQQPAVEAISQSAPQTTQSTPSSPSVEP